MTDHELVLRLEKGDDTAFDELYSKYKEQAVRTAFLITRNRELSFDITQEAFIRCYVSISKLKNPDMFRSWFFKILIRTAWEMSKKDSAAIPVEEIFEKCEKNGTVLNDGYDFRLLYEAVNALSKKQRTVIVLHYFNDLPVKEIAKITGSFESTVKSQLFLARKKLKSYMEKSERKGGLIADETRQF